MRLGQTRHINLLMEMEMEPMQVSREATSPGLALLIGDQGPPGQLDRGHASKLGWRGLLMQAFGSVNRLVELSKESGLVEWPVIMGWKRKWSKNCHAAWLGPDVIPRVTGIDQVTKYSVRSSYCKYSIAKSKPQCNLSRRQLRGLDSMFNVPSLSIPIEVVPPDWIQHSVTGRPSWPSCPVWLAPAFE